MKKTFLSIIAGGWLQLGCIPASAFEFGREKIPEVAWDAQSLIIDVTRVAPVMGEFHYSRLPDGEWRETVSKMKIHNAVLCQYIVLTQSECAFQSNKKKVDNNKR